MMKNCDLGLENAARGLQPQFFTMQTSQPANNIYIFHTFAALTRETLFMPLRQKLKSSHHRVVSVMYFEKFTTTL